MDPTLPDRPSILRRLTAHGPVTVIVAGGGTGGHTYPAASAVRALRTLAIEADTDIEILWVGTPDSLEERVATEHGIEFAAVRAGKLRRDRNPLKMLNTANLRDAVQVPLSVLAARALVTARRPHAVLTTGGYVSAPIGMAARLRRHRVPLVIHEQTTGLGAANALLARVADRIALSSYASVQVVPARLRARTVVTGNPIRPELANGDPQAAIKALEWSGHDPSLPTVYVTGGAQGARQINDLIAALLPELLPVANVIHQCGRNSHDEVSRHAATLLGALAARYQVREFIGTELPDVLALADVVVSRSGAGTLAELTTLGKPSVLIPYPHSVGGEQLRNATYLAEHGAARSIGITPTAQDLRDNLFPLLAAPTEREAMSGRARAMGHPDAAQHLALTVLDLALP
ncbi:UDP-N-acetylglucosamine--N-acetylmuramyl-(pentapeptide) pyrophosphoryl-undecaprenol N-acetylglucosamine transferase [Nocardia arizonensis]|uniref:UDP-N-acetylglucosamine--N-acetylmuramyl- (pentapeptide) pyrophosphoryl-undecaprenol N-acetylglucosamine transferase n=1 Tax=Nocardia arizonensis TaxID=1141647 RepID=UPI000B30209D|nr:UDP-N-acetylglucosamine--N-acetylmuramyl-(pentapeptide) pyrophosphoryl-undecaprenol N-acetylglucosamine transferase [Nocardia arizonensis]